MNRITCKKCNRKINSAVLFCPYCGEKNISAGFYSYKGTVTQPSGTTYSKRPVKAKVHTLNPKLWSKKKKIIIGIISIMLIFGVIRAVNDITSENGVSYSAGNTVGNSLVGTWNLAQGSNKNAYDKMVLFSNGACSITGDGSSYTEQGKWAVTDGQLRITGANGGNFLILRTLTSNYKTDSNLLTLTNVLLDGDLINGYLIYEKEDTTPQGQKSNDCPDNVLLSIIEQQIQENSGLSRKLTSVKLTNKSYSKENGFSICNFTALAEESIYSYDSWDERLDHQLIYIELHNLVGSLYYDKTTEQWLINSIEDEPDGRGYDFSPLIGTWENKEYSITIHSVSDGRIAKMGEACIVATVSLEISDQNGNCIERGNYNIKPVYSSPGGYVFMFRFFPPNEEVWRNVSNGVFTIDDFDRGLYCKNGGACMKK